VIGGRLREHRIVDGWPDILRLVGSIRASSVVPSHIVKKLAANPRQSSLARALTDSAVWSTHALSWTSCAARRSATRCRRA
jgi:TnpA family transposase